MRRALVPSIGPQLALPTPTPGTGFKTPNCAVYVKSFEHQLASVPVCERNATAKARIHRVLAAGRQAVDLVQWHSARVRGAPRDGVAHAFRPVRLVAFEQ
jgi:hypothetical protein